MRKLNRAMQNRITEFWVWWPTVRDDISAALAQGEEGLPKKLRRAVSAKVSAMHPELSWEFIDGALARNGLVLTSEGSPDLRVLTQRWRRAGPGDDDEWEFYPSRPPNPRAMHSELKIGKRAIKPLDARFGVEVDSARARVHVLISHPDLAYLEDAERLWFGFLLLDWILGEDDVERWIGEVRFSDAVQEHDGPGLRQVVTRLSRELGPGQWAHLEGIDDSGRRVSVEVRVPAPRYSYPLFDAHCAVIIPLLHTPEMPADEITALAIDPPMPNETEISEVEAITSSLLALLGDSAVLAAIETVPDQRTLHLYADSEGVVIDQVQTWISGQNTNNPARKIRADWSLDPGWELIQHFS